MATPVRYPSLGRQFTVWTGRSSSPRQAPVSIGPARPSPVAAPAQTSRFRWVSRAALLILPVLAVLWFLDHQQQGRLAETLRGEQQSREQEGQHLRTELASLTQALTEKSALLTDLETKSQTVAKERDGAKQALATAEQALKSASADAEAKSSQLAKSTADLASARKELTEKETALTNSMNILRSEAAKLKQTLAQQEAESKNSLATLEAEKASAINQAAAAMNQVRELTAKLEQLAKEPPPAPTPQ